MPLFSIIIPTYNRAEFIRGTLDSLRAQGFTDYEVIVVDDESTDETLSILREYPWVRVLRQANQGPGAARNYGVKECTGKYIAFLDSDDIWFQWTLQTFADVIKEQNEPDLIAAKLVEFHEDHELRRVNREPLKVEVFQDYYVSSHRRFFVGACMTVVHRSVFLEVGGFTPRPVYAEDCDLALRLGLVRGFVQIVAPITLGYRQHNSNARRDYARIFGGTIYLVDSERAGRYPGGKTREGDRLRLVTLHTRPFSLACVKNGNQRCGWELYFKTLLWHVRLLRWKYLLGFPVLAGWYALHRCVSNDVSQISEEVA